MRRALSRRAFLLTSAVAALGAAIFPRGLRLAGALPVAGYFNPDADELARAAEHFDALLLPAYAAAELIARDALQSVAGTSKCSDGRAHDPEGAFTVPHTVIHFSLNEELFSPRAAWPRYGRLAIALALLRRGYPVNDQHPGHIQQAAMDLAHARPFFVRNPFAALEAASVSASGVPAITLEYDWVIPRAATNPAAAESFIRQHVATCHLPPATLTLTPLPAKSRALYAEAWQSILHFSNPHV